MTRCEVERYNNYADQQDDFGQDYTPADGVEPEGTGTDVLSMLNATGWLGDGTCDIPASITIYGVSYALDEEGKLCGLFGIASVLVLLFAYFIAARVVAGGVS